MASLVNRLDLWPRIDAGEFDQQEIKQWPAVTPADGAQFIINHYDKTAQKPRKRVITVHCITDRSGKILHRDVKYLVVGAEEYKVV